MTNTVLIKRSGTANAVPTGGQLANGEIAINYADGNLFFKDSGGSVQTIASKKFVSVTGNITGGNVDTGIVSATGNVVAGNLNAAGLSLSSNVVSALNSTANITTTANIAANYYIGNGSLLTGIAGGGGNYSNSNVATFLADFGSNVISTSGNVTAGNLTVNGNITYVNSNVVTINDKFINVANNAATSGAANGGGLGVGPVDAEYATLTFNNGTTAWNTNISLSVNGNVSGNYFVGNGSALTSISGASVTGTVANATYAVSAGSAGSAVTAEQVTFAVQANITGVGTLGNLSVSGNTTVGNLSTGGVVSATGNVTGGNLITSAAISAASVSASGNITGGNILTGGLISVTGNITGGNITIPGSANISTFIGNVFFGSVPAQPTWYTVAPLNLNNSLAAATKVQLNLINTGGGAGAGSAIDFYTYQISVAAANAEARIAGIDDGNYSAYLSLQTKTPGNTGTNGLVERVKIDSTGLSATGNITGGNILGGANVNATTHTGTTVSVTGNITGGNILGGANVNATTHTGTTVSVTGNITGGNVLGGANVNATTHTGTTVSVTGNITGGNVLGGANVNATTHTGTTVSVSGNITGGNVLGGANVNATTHTGTTVSVTGNITSGNLITSAAISAASVSASGSITGGNLIISGSISDSGQLDISTTSGNANIVLTPNGTGNVNTGANLSVTGSISTSGASGNITGANVISSTTLSATGNVTGGNITTGGFLFVGTTSNFSADKMCLNFTSAQNGLGIRDDSDSSGANYVVFRNSANGVIGTIARVTNTNAVAYNTTSDQRLKSNIADASPVLDKLMSVKVRQFDWTEGDLHQDAGFIAQELAPVLSGIVTEGRTEDDWWQLDYARLTPYLVKAMQEQQALITALTARITALENT